LTQAGPEKSGNATEKALKKRISRPSLLEKRVWAHIHPSKDSLSLGGGGPISKSPFPQSAKQAGVKHWACGDPFDMFI
jgi:hypothetical protein